MSLDRTTRTGNSSTSDDRMFDWFEFNVNLVHKLQFPRENDSTERKT